jgi:hypothetical protein
MMLIQQLFPLLTFSVADDRSGTNEVARWPAHMVTRTIDSGVTQNLQQRFA